MSQRGTKYVVLLIFTLILSNCAETSKPRLKAPAPFAGLVLGMTYWEAEKCIGDPVLTPIIELNKFGQAIQVYDYALYKTEKDRSEGKATRYRLYFHYHSNEEYKFTHLVHWAEERDWKKDEALLKKTRFK